MKPKTMILMVVAITCGLGASYMTSRLLAEKQVDESEKVAILVAKKNLDQGLTLGRIEELFEEKKFTRGEEPKNAILKVEDLLKRVLKRSLRTGDFITAEDLLSDKDAGISSIMAQGYRAVGIPVKAADIASGFASLPMSRVDLIWTKRGTSDKDTASRIILEDVLVIAADSAIIRSEGGTPMPASVVTVALKPADALAVELAKKNGDITFALRKFNDHSKSEVTSVTVEQLVTNTARRDGDDGNWVEGSEQPPVAKLQLPVLPPETQTIEIAKAEAPKGTLHRLRLIEGDKERVVEYWLDDNGQVIHNDVVRSEITPTPRPTATQTPPRPTDAQGPRRPGQPVPTASDDDDEN